MQRVDGIQFCRFLRGIQSEYEPDHDGEEEGADDRPGGEHGGHLDQVRYELREGDAEDHADQPAGDADGDRLDQKLHDDHPVCRPQRFTYPDLFCPLRHGDEHDIHDADAADDQGNSGDASEENSERLGRAFHGLQNILRIADAEIIFRARGEAVPRAEQIGDIRFRLRHDAARYGGERNGIDIGDAHHPFLHCREGAEDPVVLVLERIAFFFQNADHRKGIIIDADLLTDGALPAEEIVGDGLPHDGHPFSSVKFLLRPVAAFRDAEAGHVFIFRRHAVYLGRPVFISRHDDVTGTDHGRTVSNIGQIFHGQIVLVCERLHGARRRADAGFSARARAHGEQIRAEAGNIIFNILPDAVPDGHERDDRRHTDDDAEHRQQRPQFAGGDRFPRHDDAFPIDVCHGSAPLTSLLICPSERITWRTAYPATSSSWVTRITVFPD